MEFDDLPRASPDTFPAIRAAFIDDGDLRLLQLDRVFGANAHTATAEIAFAGDDVDHERRGTRHRSVSSE
jgi:hypothetical protein